MFPPETWASLGNLRRRWILWEEIGYTHWDIKFPTIPDPKKVLHFIRGETQIPWGPSPVEPHFLS